MAKNILIFGGEGYVGSIVIDSLIKNKFNILSIDSLIYDQEISNKPYSLNQNYTFKNFDIRNELDLKNQFTNIDAVIILAGLVGDPITKKYPKESSDINEKGIKNIINLSIKNKIEKLIFISTCSNYGLIKNDELADEDYILNPLSSYAKSKVEIEKYLLSFKNIKNFHPTILRFATAFGLSHRMRFDLTLNEFTRDLYFMKPLEVYDPDTWRPYCHVLDFSELIIKVLEAEKQKISFQVFNAGGESNNYTKRMVIDEIKKFIINVNVIFKDKGQDPRNYRVNFNKVKKILKFEPKFSVNDGIGSLINEFQKNKFNDSYLNKFKYGNYHINIK